MGQKFIEFDKLLLEANETNLNLLHQCKRNCAISAYAVIRPESIHLARFDVKIDKAMNIFEGIIDSSMFFGSTMRYTVLVRDKRFYLDESDPQYKGIFNIGEKVKLILKNRIHMLSV